MKTLSDCAERFLNQVHKPSRRQYRSGMNKILSYVGHIRPSSLKADDLTPLLRYLEESNLSPASKNHTLAVLKSFLSYCRDSGWIRTIPRIKNFRGECALPRALSREDEFCITSRAWGAYQNDPQKCGLLLMVLLMLECGLRTGEALEVRKSDFITEGGVARAVIVSRTIGRQTTKGGRSRTVPIKGDLGAQIGLLTHNLSSDDRLAGNLNQRNFWAEFGVLMWREPAVKATPYALRHTFATRLFEKGEQLPTISKLLGHASVTTTMRYLRVTDEAMQKAVGG